MLRSVVIVDRKLRRVWLLGKRYHHGKLGVQLVVAGLALCAHDWHDRFDWFRKEPWT